MTPALPSQRTPAGSGRRRIRPAGSGLADDEVAVSTVLGAILMFGLLITTLVMVRVKFVPVWDHDREAAYTDAVAAQLAYVKAQFDAQVANQTSGAISAPILLGHSQGFGFTHGPETQGVLAFTPGGANSGFTVSATSITIQARNGVSLQGLAPYTSITSGSSLTNVAGLVNLGLRLDNPMTASNAATLRIDVTDPYGACAGQLIIAIGAGATPPRDVNVATYSSYTGACLASPGIAAVHVRDDLIGCTSPCVSPTVYYVDGLDPDLQFGAVLSTAPTPYTVTFTLTGTTAMTASRSIVYDQAVPGGSTRVGAGGVTASGYTSTVAVGNLTLDKQNNQFPSQFYSFEYGAILLDQSGGSAMVAGPDFAVRTSSTQATLYWVVPALTGTANEVGASDSAVLTSTPAGARTSLDALVPNCTFTISTPHASAWRDYWNTTLTNAGFTRGTHYTTAQTATSATLTFYGPTPAPGDSTTDIVLHLQATPLDIALRATG